MKKHHSSGEEDTWEYQLSEHQIRGWRAVSAAGLLNSWKFPDIFGDLCKNKTSILYIFVETFSPVCSRRFPQKTGGRTQVLSCAKVAACLNIYIYIYTYIYICIFVYIYIYITYREVLSPKLILVIGASKMILTYPGLGHGCTHPASRM